eukprot:scaffold143944_cov127-Phaeocystis_antarctica.AAC.1
MRIARCRPAHRVISPVHACACGALLPKLGMAQHRAAEKSARVELQEAELAQLRPMVKELN